ncbi:hypothetical protein QFZ73_004700 [Peribacillus sp. V2I11]|nr:hypothetical protein [Peribacillus sp. V2I11]
MKSIIETMWKTAHVLLGITRNASAYKPEMYYGSFSFKTSNILLTGMLPL